MAAPSIRILPGPQRLRVLIGLLGLTLAGAAAAHAQSAPGSFVNFESGHVRPLAMSPDGRAVAFVARTGGPLCLHVRRLDTREDLSLPGTEDARDPFFSPDGEWIGFFDSHQLMKVSVHGGEPIALAPSTADRGAVWLDDGTIVFAADAIQPLSRISSGGGAVTHVTALDSTRLERTHRWPDALAGGPWVVFTVGVQNSPGNYDGSDIDAVNVKTGERRHLIKGARHAIWVAPDHVVFDRKGTLFALKMNPRDPRANGEAVPVLEGVAGDGSSGASYIGASRDGSLAWVPSHGEDTQRLVGWFDRNGAWTPSKFAPGECRASYVSPDGRSALLLFGAGGGAGDVWLGDFASGNLRRLTYTNVTNSFSWLPDGQSFAYSLVDSLGSQNVALRRVDGAGGVRVVARVNGNSSVMDVTPDGSEVLVADWGQANGRLYTVSLRDSGAKRSIATDLGPTAYETMGQYSPDGRWLAYVSNRTGREEVFVRSRDGGSGQWQVSTHGGGGVRWGRDSRELFFIEDEMLKSAQLTPGPSGIAVGTVTALFEVPASPIEPTFRDYSYDPNSDRFLFTRPPSGTDERREIALSIGWGRRLAATRPTKRNEP